jgi:hypothetical protein
MHGFDKPYHLARDRARELLKNAHSAMADVHNCLIILQHILLRMQPEESATWEAIWCRSELARIPTVMTFGKHKGMPIKDVPAITSAGFSGSRNWTRTLLRRCGERRHETNQPLEQVRTRVAKSLIILGS